MLTKENSLTLLTNWLDLVEAEIGELTFQFALLLDTLTDPPRWKKWEHIFTHEASYAGYVRQTFLRADIIGPENWEEGHYLRFPQTSFAPGAVAADVRWIAALGVGTSETRILSLEKLGTIWDPSEASTPLEHVLKVRTRLALP